MRWFVIVCPLALWAMVACGKKPVPPPSEPTSSATAVDVVDAVDAPKIGRLYSRAIDQARKEITPENARARLLDLEREIESDEGRTP